MEQIPETGVQENLTQLMTGEGQTPTAVFVQEGEKVEETFAVELREVHGEPSRGRKSGPRPRGGNRPAVQQQQ